MAYQYKREQGSCYLCPDELNELPITARVAKRLEKDVTILREQKTKIDENIEDPRNDFLSEMDGDSYTV